MSSVVLKRENVMTSEEYCRSVRNANKEQRDLILEAIHHIYDAGGSKPLQIFLTGPAGCGKTFTMKLLMETYNRFSGEQKNSAFNSYVVCASTGIAAAAINGRTVHSAFRIPISAQENNFLLEKNNYFCRGFVDTRIIFVDECSMIGSGLLSQMNSRLQNILNQHDKPFAGKNIIFCGDLRQLPPVCQEPIYKRSKTHSDSEALWQSLSYYPLSQIVRQADISFSSILTKIGDGVSLTPEETATIESRFRSKVFVDENFPNSIRLFFRTTDVNTYNSNTISGAGVIECFATDTYSGHRNNDELVSAQTQVRKMKLDETGNMPFAIKLLTGKPYMIRVNINVLDGIVNGLIGTLRFVEHSQNRDDKELKIKRLWLSFDDPKIGKSTRDAHHMHAAGSLGIHHDWVPVCKGTVKISLKNRLIRCVRQQFPVVEACAITVHKSQGGTHDTVIYEYDKNHDQRMVYVAMSRVTTLQGLYLTNRASDHKFYHSRGKINRDLRNEFRRLENHKLETIGNVCRRLINHADSHPTVLSLLTLNAQNLKEHSEDISTDSILSAVKMLALTETWIGNDERIDIPGFRPICQFKRDSVQAAGVCVYERNDSGLVSTIYNLTRLDESVMKIREASAYTHECVGDICAVETIIDGKRVLVVTVYITPDSTLRQIMKFFDSYLLAYSPPKISDSFTQIDQHDFATIPIILSGDLNFSLNTNDWKKFISFMADIFDLQLINDPAESATTRRNVTCFGLVFTRYIQKIDILPYITYFSCHKPLLCVAGVTTESVVKILGSKIQKRERHVTHPPGGLPDSINVKKLKS